MNYQKPIFSLKAKRTSSAADHLIANAYAPCPFFSLTHSSGSSFEALICVK